jgi:hypothetical protein
VKFISLSPREPRCRPEPPNQILHNDCGMQAKCARRLAANTIGALEFDYSRKAQSMMGMLLCHQYIDASSVAQVVKHT